MGRHRHAGRTLQNIALASRRLCSGCTFYVFGPDWFLPGRAFVLGGSAEQIGSTIPAKVVVQADGVVR